MNSNTTVKTHPSLVSRKDNIKLPRTRAVWNHEEQFKIYRSGVDKTLSVLIFGRSNYNKAKIYDFCESESEKDKEAIPFSKLFASTPELFFNQPAQISSVAVMKKLSIEKQLAVGRRLYIPIMDITQSLYVMCIFSNRGWMHLHLADYRSGSALTKKPPMFLFPLLK